MQPKGENKLTTTDYQALVGHNQLDDAVRKNKFSNIFVHPEWNSTGPSYDADIAIFELESELYLNDNIQPICLPRADAEIFNVEGTIVGFGAGGNDPKQLNIRSMGNEACLETRSDFKAVEMFCVEDTRSGCYLSLHLSFELLKGFF